MSDRLKALTISLTLHGGFLFLVYALSVGFAQTGKPIRIDFTLNEPAPGPLSPKPQQQSVRKQEASRPRIAAREAQKPATHPPAPRAPATELAGPVPITAVHRETLPVPGSAHLNAKGTSAGSESGPAVAGNTGGSNGGGGGAGIDQLRSKYRKEHFEYIRKIIQENIVYPPRAQRNGWEGRVVARFSVMQNGKVKDLRIAKSCGFDILDENVIETVRKVEPFPKPPVAVELIIPVEYRL